MAEIIQIGWRNYADTATLSGGSWASTLPLTNLQRRPLSKIARSTNALTTSTVISIDMGSSSAIVGKVMLWGHNISQTGTIEITAGTTAGASDIYSSGVLSVWPALAPEDLEWEDDNWWFGTLSDSDVEGYPIRFSADCGDNITARYWKIQITDTSNADGYVEAGRLWMGPFWSPTINYAPGAGLSWEPRSDEQRSRGGVLYFDQQASVRVFSFQLSAVTDVEAWGTLMELQRTAGNAREVVVIPDPGDAQYGHKRDILGRLRKSDALTIADIDGWQTAGFEVEELL